MKREQNEGLIIMMADSKVQSYFPEMQNIPEFLNNNLQANNYMLIYPFSVTDDTVIEKRAVSNHRDFVEIGKVIGKIFR